MHATRRGARQTAWQRCLLIDGLLMADTEDATAPVPADERAKQQAGIDRVTDGMAEISLDTERAERVCAFWHCGAGSLLRSLAARC